MTCRQRLEKMLDEAGVAHELVTHRLAYTAQEVADAEHISGYDVAKVVMAMADGKLVMLVLPAPTRVDFIRLKQLLGAQTVRLAEEREFGHVFPDCEVGAMPPFGHLYQVPVYVDRALTADPEIVFNAGTHRETLTVAYKDYERVARPTVLEMAIAPRMRTA
jgi:Ala-tRNA(Pro) deacylase